MGGYLLQSVGGAIFVNYTTVSALFIIVGGNVFHVNRNMHLLAERLREPNCKPQHSSLKPCVVRNNGDPRPVGVGAIVLPDGPRSVQR